EIMNVNNNIGAYLGRPSAEDGHGFTNPSWMLRDAAIRFPLSRTASDLHVSGEEWPRGGPAPTSWGRRTPNSRKKPGLEYRRRIRPAVPPAHGGIPVKGRLQCLRPEY